MTRFTKSPRSSTSRLRYVLLLSLSLSLLSQQSALSQDGAIPSVAPVRCGIFQPCPSPEPQIEPNAGNWKTWLLEDARQIRPPGPPARSISEQEIGVLKQLSFNRDAEALDLVNYWDAGSPSLRWNEFAVDQVPPRRGIHQKL